MATNFEGSEILRLLNNGLDPKLSVPIDVRQQFEAAEERRLRDPKKASDICSKMLNRLEQGPTSDSSDPETPRYVKGKFNLLLGSIYLNEDKNLEQAEKHFRESRNEFVKWFQLGALALVGLAIAQRKLNKLEEAMSSCNSARGSVNQADIMPDLIPPAALEALSQLIENESATIRGLISAVQAETPEQPPLSDETPEPPPFSTETPEPTPLSAEEAELEARVPLFKISTGDGVIAAGGTTELNMLGFEDYEQNSVESAEWVIVDLGKRKFRDPSYILEIDDGVKPEPGLGKGDWLLIREEKEPKRPGSKTIAILRTTNNETYVGLRTFHRAEDHCFLKAKSASNPSIILGNYKSDLSKITKYYAIDGQRVEGKFVYEVQVIGYVYRIPQKDVNKIIRTFVWRVPVVSRIAAGLDRPILEDNIEDYAFAKAETREDPGHFVTIVQGDSMIQDSISDGAKALIRQREEAKNGNIVAAIIRTPEETLEVLKRYYLIGKQKMMHWLLASSSTQSEHIVAMPLGASINEIRDYYRRKRPDRIFKFYENAEITIAGKYIRTL